jgi:hypothetical protein
MAYGSTGWEVASDIILKKNIQRLKNSLKLINKLNTITYNCKVEVLTNINIVFVALEVQEVLPKFIDNYIIKDEN